MLLILILAGTALGVPVFTQNPVMNPGGPGGFVIEFTLSEAADVEVSLVNPLDSTVVRHLAAGMLGATPPAPLQGGTLHQTLAWDGRDDRQRIVPNASSCLPRVRAGMSVSLDGMIGENNYRFYRAVRGLALDSAGSLYAFGAFPWLAHHGTSGMALRKYTRDGDYAKTLWPVPAGLNPSSLSLYEVVALPGNRYIPRTEAVDAPQIGGTPLTYENSFLCPQTVDGNLMVCDYPLLRFITLRPDGTPVSTGTLVKSPAIPAASSTRKFSGPMYLTLSPDRSYFLLSGCYQMDSVAGLGWFPSDTGAWRDGQVCKVNAVTGAASALISVPRDSLPRTVALRRTRIGPSGGDLGYMAALHGTAFDDSGHIFVCNRLFNEVGVYDATGVKLGALGVVNPDQVAVNRLTGAVYVLSRRFAYSFNNSYPPVAGVGVLTLTKFASWRATSGQTLALGKAAKAGAVMDMTKTAPNTYGRLNMVMDCSGPQAVIWLNGPGGTNYCLDSALTNIRGYRDDGNALALIRDFRSLTRSVCTGFDRIAVDRRSEKVYVNNSWNEAYKIEDWADPVFVRCSTSLGRALPATDLTIGPDGFLYVHENLYDGPLTRYTQDHLHAPANFGTRGTHVVIAHTYFGFGGGTQDRGLAVSGDGTIYTFNGSYLNTKLQKYDTTGALLMDNVVGLGLTAGGLKVDNAGKIYIGAFFRPPEQIIPPVYSSYWPASYSTGAIVKFEPDGSGAFTNVTASNPAGRSVANALKVYKTPVSPFSERSYSTVYVPSNIFTCYCRSPRFEMDPYGRLFVPHTVVGSVTVIDNAGNEILAFGEYGNADSRGPGSPVPGPAIPFAWPAGVAASEDFIYVTDLVNARLVRVRMNYALDNLPDITLPHPGLARMAAPAPQGLRAGPNPFNGRVTIRLPEGFSAGISIYTSAGKRIRTLGRGVSSVAWDGRDDDGRALPNGIYFCRLEAPSHRQAVRLCYLR